MAAGFLVRRVWKPVLAIYVIMLSAYFIHPLGRQLPLWTILDILLSHLNIPNGRDWRKTLWRGSKYSAVSMIFASSVSTVTESFYLFRQAYMPS